MAKSTSFRSRSTMMSIWPWNTSIIAVAKATANWWATTSTINRWIYRWVVSMHWDWWNYRCADTPWCRCGFESIIFNTQAYGIAYQIFSTRKRIGLNSKRTGIQQPFIIQFVHLPMIENDGNKTYFLIDTPGHHHSINKNNRAGNQVDIEISRLLDKLQSPSALWYL